MASIPRSEYDEYVKQVESIVRHGSKEQLERLYREIMAKYGNCGDLHMLDEFHNPKWRIL